MSETIQKVADRLRDFDVPASYEYPGFVLIGEVLDWSGTTSFGTANGKWGWTDEDGNGGESEIPGDSTDVEKIVDWILTVLKARGEQAI